MRNITLGSNTSANNSATVKSSNTNGSSNTPMKASSSPVAVKSSSISSGSTPKPSKEEKVDGSPLTKLRSASSPVAVKQTANTGSSPTKPMGIAPKIEAPAPVTPTLSSSPQKQTPPLKPARNGSFGKTTAVAPNATLAKETIKPAVSTITAQDKQNSNENNVEKSVEVLKQKKGSDITTTAKPQTSLKHLKSELNALSKRATLFEISKSSSLPDYVRESIREYDKKTGEVVDKLKNLVTAIFSQDKEELYRKKLKNVEQKAKIIKEKNHLGIEYSKQFFAAFDQKQDDKLENIAENIFFDPSKANGEGELALNKAVAANKVSTVMKLLSNGNLNPSLPQPKDGETALHVILNQKATEVDVWMLKILILKIDASVRNKSGQTAEELFLAKNSTAKVDMKVEQILEILKPSNLQSLSSSPKTTNLQNKPPIPERPRNGSFNKTITLLDKADMKETGDALNQLNTLTTQLEQSKKSILNEKVMSDFIQFVTNHEQKTRDVAEELKMLVTTFVKEKEVVQDESQKNEDQLARIVLETERLNQEYSQKFTTAVDNKNWSEVDKIISNYYFNPNLEKRKELPLNVVMQYGRIDTVKALLDVTNANVPQSKDGKTALFTLLEQPTNTIDEELLELILKKINPLHLCNNKTAMMAYLGSKNHSGNDEKACRIAATLSEHEQKMKKISHDSKVVLHVTDEIYEAIREQLVLRINKNNQIAASMESETDKLLKKQNREFKQDMERFKDISVVRELDALAMENIHTYKKYSENFHRSLMRIVETKVVEHVNDLNKKLLLKDEIKSIQSSLELRVQSIRNKLSDMYTHHKDEKIVADWVNKFFPDPLVKTYKMDQRAYQPKEPLSPKRTDSFGKLVEAAKAAKSVFVPPTSQK